MRLSNFPHFLLLSSTPNSRNNSSYATILISNLILNPFNSMANRKAYPLNTLYAHNWNNIHDLNRASYRIAQDPAFSSHAFWSVIFRSCIFSAPVARTYTSATQDADDLLAAAAFDRSAAAA
jgi:hypothetical protein